MSSEPKIQHTDALQLCHDLKNLQASIGSLQHELVLHYCATGVPSHKTRGSVESLSGQMARVEQQLDVIRAELDNVERKREVWDGE